MSQVSIAYYCPKIGNLVLVDLKISATVSFPASKAVWKQLNQMLGTGKLKQTSPNRPFKPAGVQQLTSERSQVSDVFGKSKVTTDKSSERGMSK